MTTQWLDVSDTTARIGYEVGSPPTTGPFTFPFVIAQNSDLTVYVDDEEQGLNIDFTLIGAGDPEGGSITFVSPVSNCNVEIVRHITVELTTHFPSSGPFNISALNLPFSRIIMMIQQISAYFTRAIHFADSDPALSAELAPVSIRKIACSASTPMAI